MQEINLAEKFAAFDEQWRPKIIGQVNDCYVKLAKLKGEFIWHTHDDEDELFLVVKGELAMRFRDKTVTVGEGEVLIVPRGVEHLPIAEEEVHVMLLEPKSTVNTGSTRNERTLDATEHL